MPPPRDERKRPTNRSRRSGSPSGTGASHLLAAPEIRRSCGKPTGTGPRCRPNGRPSARLGVREYDRQLRHATRVRVDKTDTAISRRSDNRDRSEHTLVKCDCRDRDRTRRAVASDSRSSVRPQGDSLVITSTVKSAQLRPCGPTRPTVNDVHLWGTPRVWSTPVGADKICSTTHRNRPRGA